MTKLFPDNILIQNAQENPAEFKMLYEKYYKLIFLFLHKRTRNISLAHDLAADTFLIALEQLHKYEDRGLPFSAWLYRIATNELNKYFRKNKKAEWLSFTNEEYLYFNHELDSEEGDMEESFKLLEKALGSLKEEERNLIAFTYAEMKSYSEIAGIKGTTEENIKVKMFRIRNKIKQFISKIQYV